jgi:hypothetical protein
MNYRAILLLLVAIFVFSPACKRKYEEGPFFSVIPAKDRLTRDWNWVLARRTTDGVTENLSQRLTDATLSIKDDGSWSENRYNTVGNWELVSNNNELNLIFEQRGDSLGVPSTAVAFDIRQLTQKDLWLIFEDSVEILEWQLVAAE